MILPSRQEVLARAATLRARFEAAGAQVVETPILQSAETLLDLYGEDIRARAYVTSDALRGEQMLRPDFTVPVVQMHMAEGADPARYTYAGEVFRRQEHDPERANEFIQVGYEIFDRTDPCRADAEVFSLIEEGLKHLPLRAVTGDIGILMAAVSGLDTTPVRRAALLRHIWRPARFRALLERFGAKPDGARQEILAQADPLAEVGPEIGLRRRKEVMARLDALREDARTPPLAATEIAALESLLSVRDMLPGALERLRGISAALPSIAPALDRLSERITALRDRGVAVESLRFEASYGRASMEYYDGFVFGFHGEDQLRLPALASGGRYDALTRRLGEGGKIPAVGGVLRPGLIVQLEKGAAP